MSVELRGTVIYPMFPTNAAMTSIRALERTNISSYRGPTTTGRPGVRAAAPLGVNSSTEVIDVNRLSQRSTSVTRYVRVADSKGRLYCVDGLANASCWLKIVTLARDCQSSNVELISTEKGVALKTIKCVSPGEPLLMWFNQNLLATMNMPFLTPSNIQGQNRYICHICNNHFEYPNPLKIHLVLKCNRLDSDHLWNILAKEFNSATPRPSLPLNFFPPSIEPFGFELSGSPRTSPTRISPIIADTPDSSASLANDSPTSSNRASPTSSNGPSPNSSKRTSPESSLRISPSSSSRASPVRKTLAHRGTSAFKPYANKPNVLGASHGAVLGASRCNETTMHSHGGYRRVAPPAPLRTDDHAARMETIVSNLGKSKQGHLCIYCGKVYSRKYGLKIHIRTHTGYKPLKCKFCLRPFGDPSNLNKHVRLHADGETPYRCELCGKILVRRRDLERHVRSRHHRENAGHVSDASSDGTNA